MFVRMYMCARVCYEYSRNEHVGANMWIISDVTSERQRQEQFPKISLSLSVFAGRTAIALIRVRQNEEIPQCLLRVNLRRKEKARQLEYIDPRESPFDPAASSENEAASERFTDRERTRVHSTESYHGCPAVSHRVGQKRLEAIRRCSGLRPTAGTKATDADRLHPLISRLYTPVESSNRYPRAH